jgi:hypothetical protein
VIFGGLPDARELTTRYRSQLIQLHIEYPGPYRKIRDKQSVKVREDLVRTVGARRLEFAKAKKLPESDDTLLLSLLRIIMFLPLYHPKLRYRQMMIDLVVPFYQVVFYHFGPTQRYVVEAVSVEMFVTFMNCSHQIDWLPGALNFERERHKIERSIIQNIEGDYKHVCESITMVRMTAVKWYVTMFVQDFELPDVLEIWDDLINGGIDEGFATRMALMCGRVFALFPQELAHAEEENMMQKFSQPLRFAVKSKDLLTDP